MELNPNEQDYYSRQIILKEFGIEAQQKLKDAAVLCIGAGGLGSPALMYLAGAGIGTIGIVDFDVIDITNLHRQVLHTHHKKGQLKVRSAVERLHEINPNININAYNEKLNIDNVEHIFRNYDLIVDGTDNFNTRYLVNDACVLLNKPLIFGSVFRYEGQVSVFATKEGPCYRCMYPVPPNPSTVATCADDGILGVLPGMIGTMQANETIKMITGIGKPLIGRFLTMDAKSMQFTEHKLKKNPNCPICSDKATITSLQNDEIYCQIISPLEVTYDDLIRLEKEKETIIIDIRNAYELEGSTVKDAIHIPMDDLENKIDQFDATKHLILFCQKGQRSLRTASRLKEKHPYLFSLQDGVMVLKERFL